MARTSQKDPNDIEGKVAKLLYDKIEYGPKTQGEIASEAGFKNANIISMMKWGEFKVPVEKAAIIAKAIDVDERYFMELVLEEYMPESWKTIVKVLGGFPKSETESKLLGVISKVSKGGKFDFKTDKASLTKLEKFLKENMLA